MKRIQTLLAVVICMLAMSSFTEPLPVKTVKLPNKVKIPNKAVDVQVDFSHECQTPSLVYKYRVFINGNEHPGCGVPIGTDTYYAPAGTHVSIEIDVHPTSGMYFLQIDDYDGHGGSETLFYADSPAYVTYNFPLVAGHYYYIYTRTF